MVEELTFITGPQQDVDENGFKLLTSPRPSALACPLEGQNALFYLYSSKLAVTMGKDT